MVTTLLAICCATTILYSCNSKREVDAALVYATLNEIIRQDSIFATVVCRAFDQVKMADEIQKEFFQGEHDFVEAQLKSSLNATVDTGQLYFYINEKKGFQKVSICTACSAGIVYRIAYPIFSSDLQTVVIGVTEDCNCMLGGWGFNAVYQRRNGQWVKVKDFGRWIS